jgi:mannose/fructose/N-acetylgalactosamine-specific phosphotransferase system component IIB
LKFGYNCFSKCVDVSWGWGMSSLTLASLDLKSFQVILESLLVIFNSVDTALKLTKDVVNVVSVSVGSLNFRHDISATLASTKESL